MMFEKQSQSTSRGAFKSSLFVSTITLLFFTCLFFLFHIDQSAIHSIDEQVDFILSTTPLTDTHIDFPIKLLYHFKNKIAYQDLETLPQGEGFEGFDTDLGRLKKV